MQNEITRNALILERQKELNYYQRALDTQWLNNRMADGRMGRCLALIKKEAQMEKDFQERTDHAAIVNARAAKEAKLATEVAKIRQEEDKELLRRHYLRDRDPGLRSLIQKLQSGYACRDLRQQIQQNEYRRLQEKAEEQRANATLLGSIGDDKKAEERELKKIHETAEYCKELQQQLVNRQRQKQCQYEDALIEQKMLDDVMRTIADEDQRELQQKRDLMAQTQREMVSFQRARDAWRAKQRVAAVQEEADIERQQQAVADRTSSIIAERQRVERVKDEINAKICAKIMADEAERQDRDDVIRQLQEHELEEQHVQDDIAERRKRERARSGTKGDLTAQMNLKMREREQEKEREVEYRKETQAKLAALDEKENAEQRMKKEKARRYATELKQQIESNARRRESERRHEDARAKAVFDYDKEWQAEVSREREKIVEEHVPLVLGYVQAGAVARADLPAARRGAARDPRLATLDIESMAGAGEVERHPKCNAQCRILREF